jgi:hypothetical protein
MYLAKICNADSSEGDVLKSFDTISLRTRGDAILVWLLKRFGREAERMIRSAESGESRDLEMHLNGFLLPRLSAEFRALFYRNQILNSIAETRRALPATQTGARVV